MVAQATPKKRPSIIRIALAGLAGFCVCCVVISSAMNAIGLVPTRTPSAIPTGTMPAPAISTFPLEPTRTLLPTDTPLPTSTPTSQISSDPYYEEMMKRIDAYQAARIKFTVQHKNFLSNPQLLTDPNWKLAVGSTLESLQVAAEDLQNIPDKTPSYERIDLLESVR